MSFVAALEDVLTVYEPPYEEAYPQVCLDEKLVTLHGDVVEPLPVEPGHPERVDYEYERVGTANLFVMVECPAPILCTSRSERNHTCLLPSIFHRGQIIQ